MGASCSSSLPFLDNIITWCGFQASSKIIFSSKAVLWMENDEFNQWLSCQVEVSDDMKLFVKMGPDNDCTATYQIYEWANPEIIIRGNGFKDLKVDGLSFEKLVDAMDVSGGVLVSEYLKDFSGLFDYALTIRGVRNGKSIFLCFFMENDQQVRDFTTALETSMKGSQLYDMICAQKVHYEVHANYEDGQAVATGQPQEMGAVENRWFLKLNSSTKKN